MLAKEAVSRRMESDEGISYAEFSYQLLQSYDFLELYRRYGCTLQTGGSDQWGNLTAGTDLVHRVEGRSLHALGTPLITKADGTKFGKTEGGTVWLDRELTSPYAFYQFWIQAEDAMVGTYLRAFTWLSHAEIEELERLTVEKPAAREAQRALAAEVTAMVHGADEVARVEAASRALFGRGELRELDASTLAAAVDEIPSVAVARSEHPTIVDLLVGTGLASSRGAARRTVAEGGAYVNNSKVDTEDWAPGGRGPPARSLAGPAPGQAHRRRGGARRGLSVSPGGRARPPGRARAEAGAATSDGRVIRAHPPDEGRFPACVEFCSSRDQGLPRGLADN